MRPQERHAFPVRVFLSHSRHTSTFDKAHNVGRHGIWIRLDKQMNMVRLKSQLSYLPSVFLGYPLNDLLEAITDRPDQHLASSLRTEGDVVPDMVNRMLFMNLFLIAHVYERRITTYVVNIPPPLPGNSARERSLIPP